MAIDTAWASVIKDLGYNLEDHHLKDSPGRVARFMEKWHTIRTAPPKLTCFDNVEKYDQLVTVGGIRFFSMCAHHGLPFFGIAAVGPACLPWHSGFWRIRAPVSRHPGARDARIPGGRRWPRGQGLGGRCESVPGGDWRAWRGRWPRCCRRRHEGLLGHLARREGCSVLTQERRRRDARVPRSTNQSSHGAQRSRWGC